MDFKQYAVEQFHEEFNLMINDKPTIPPVKEQKLRHSLIQEERDELALAFFTNDIIEVADALGDLLYVVYGAAITCGIDLGKVFMEIHRSNMTKVGGVQNEAGKLIKPDTYSPPELAKILFKKEVNTIWQ